MSAERGRLRYQAHRVQQHLRWTRTEGVGKLLEESDVHPLQHVQGVYRKVVWRRQTGTRPGTARAVFLVGLQRSGTNMLVHGLEKSPAFDVHNENDRAAFSRFRLRFDRVEQLVAKSKQGYVLFKPLCDSHRTNDLLDSFDYPTPPRALWAYRGVDGRVRSAVAKFGDVNRRALTEIAASPGPVDRWEAGGLTDETRELIRSLDPASMSPESAAALFWYVRNSLFFQLGLDQRRDVLLTSYEEFLGDPVASMRRLCAFLELPYDDAYDRLVGAGAGAGARRPGGAPPVEMDPRVRTLCDGLEERLDAALRTPTVPEG